MASDGDERALLLEFLKRNRDRAIADWESAIRSFPQAARLDVDAIRDHLPALLDRVIEVMDGASPQLVGDVPDEHVRTRLLQGFNLQQIAGEYRALRSSLLHLLATQRVPLQAETALLLNETIDHALARALERYHLCHSRTLEALEKVSQEAFTARGEPLRDFLRRFLGVLVDTAEVLDTAVIYLREWDRLVIRAAIGIESCVEDQFGLRVGEGIAGTVAATRRPYLTANAAHDPLTRNPALVKGGVKALYAVPLVYGDDLIGVAKMGSRTACEFCTDDRQLFRDMAQRAAVVIAHRRLADEREMFLGVLGHDLKSPLSTITIGASYLRQRETLSAGGKRVVERIMSAARRMENMIGGLSDYTRSRFGTGLRIEPHVMDLADAMRRLVAELGTQNPDRSLQLELEEDLVGEWDPVRLAQVVTNLVNNAASYGDPASPITVTATGSKEAEVAIAVHNEGPPIPPALVPRLFDAFRRGRGQGSGMGLGLYIVQQVTQAHGGRVEVESTPERGTTFTVRLPRWRRR